jgi:catalase-peroxidase
MLGFCAGRLDFEDATQTQPLGPTPEQDKFAHCEVNGQCPFPLGQNTLGLVYVNPEGPMGEPDLQGAAATIRDVFGRMNWEGRELVALIGGKLKKLVHVYTMVGIRLISAMRFKGGHTFGKSHGATMESPGKSPKECPFAPWAGASGMNTVTSGFEGPWTSEPTKWDNKYFQYLVDYEWEPIMGPGGHYQWRIKGGNGPKAPVVDLCLNQTQDVMMLTTDVALAADPEYRQYVEEFAANETALTEAFAKAWYTLVTRDVGPVERCIGPKVPPALHFQNPLPEPASTTLADMDDVAHDLKKLMHKHKHENLEDDFVWLAWQCASTFRATDHQGGCNGASIRFPPGSTWPINAGLDQTLAKLEPIKEKYGKHLSYADLIVLAGTTAAERMGAPKMDFCPGRVDAKDGKAWRHLAYGNTDIPATVDVMIELYERRGQTAQEFLATSFPWYRSSEALAGMLKSNNASNIWEKGFLYYPELRYWAEHYAAAGTDDYSSDFAEAWTKVMNADRFQGPLGNVCAE